MNSLIPSFQSFLSQHGLSESNASLIAIATGGFGVLLLAILVNVLAKRVIVGVMTAVAKRTSVHWDDAFLQAGVFTRLSHIAPALVVDALGPAVFGHSPELLATVDAAVNLYLVVIVLLVLYAFLDGLYLLIGRTDYGTRVPVKGFVQAIKLIAILISGIFILSILLGKTPVYLLSGVGALTAILLLVFKDAILGFVAGIMISVNQMVRIGDWIEMDKAGADGFVIDVALTTVKVQNWDKTFTTIPSYDLIAGSFKNWRGMFESGGRRIKRALYIDMQTVRFADEAMVERWQRIALLRPYLEQRLTEVQAYNQQLEGDLSVLANGRRLTNLGTFRAYCAAYVRAHPLIHREMIFLVRQLAPTQFGLPLELYVFTSDTRWVTHEDIQSDIFDHLLAIIGEFGLQVYQQPSGYDVRQFVGALAAASRPAADSPARLP